MFKRLKDTMLNDNQMYLHEKKVDIPKLTPERWKKLFEKVDLLPGLIVQVILAPKENMYSTLITACELAMDEIIEVVALLSELDEEYIRNEVGLDETIEFLARVVKRNRLNDAVKNLQSLLPAKKEVQKAKNESR